MMGWLQLALVFLQLVSKIWDAIHETNVELKKEKTNAAQSGIRGIIDRDASRINSAFDELRRLRGL